MKITALRPMLRTRDIDTTIRFYVDVLGFALINYDEDFGWASLKNNNVQIMIASPNAHFPFDKADFTGSFYFSVEDVDSVWEKLKDKTEIVYPLETFDYGMREFAIYDNNGYMLQFGEEVG